MALRIDIPNLDNLIERYVAGESAYALSKESGVGAAAFSNRLRDRGIHRRTNSESQRIRMSRPEEAALNRERNLRRMAAMTAEERQAITAKAHEATRGRIRPQEEALRHALAVERSEGLASPAARQLAADIAFLSDAAVTLEKAVGKYNVDIGVEQSVAVEVCGGHWHLEKRHRTRSAYLFDQGWNLMFVWTQEPRHPLTLASAEDVIAFLERSQSDPTFRRQYRMIWGSGEFVSAGRADGDDWTLVGPFKRRMN